jgi:gas vesicle protein
MSSHNRNGNRLGMEVGLFAAGALVGGAIAMLSTPYSGRKVRRMLRHKLDEGSEFLQECTTDFVEQCGQLYEKSKRLASQADKMFSKVTSH